MSIPTIIAVYFVIWWITFVGMANMFMKSQGDVGEIVEGTPAGAPHQHNLKLKLLAVTIVAAMITGFVYWVIVYSGWSLSDYPFMPDFKDYK